jgi:hypothetical protein
MNCKYHPDRKAESFCTSCNAPLCSECVERGASGEPYCYECAMLHSLTAVGTSLKKRKSRGEKRKQQEKKRWGPFGYFVIVSTVLIAVMWGVIIFGGKPSPQRSADFSKKGRVLLFMVDGALKRYAHYEKDMYPIQLSELVPRYLSLQKEEIGYLEKLSYKRDPKLGYRLSIAKPQAGEINVILTPQGLEYSVPSSGGA